MFDYLNERGGTVILEAIDKPPFEWRSPLAVMKQVVDHEAHVTALINNLVDCALEERDHAMNHFLQWFVGEQVEEEASVGEVYDKLKMIDGHSAGMFAMDLELGKRVFTPPENE
jgi:ferritin